MKKIIKEKLKNILKIMLRRTAILTLKKYQPIVIGITGSVGKTSAKEAIFSVLKNKFICRRNYANFNNELGVPLTIIGEYQEIKGQTFWWQALGRAWINLFFLSKKSAHYPQILILEIAADRPGDIAYLAEMIKPQIAVITAIGEIPVHVEYYSSPEAVAKEKGKLVESLPTEGTAILNQDDAMVLNLKNKTKAKTLTFGFSPEADVSLGNFEYRQDEKGEVVGISFKVQHGGSFAPIRLQNSYGRPQAYAAGVAIAVGLSLGLNLVEIGEALLNYQTPAGRMKLISGQNETVILDDCYNSSPLSLRAAIETLNDLPAKRKIAILGDMKEIGNYSDTAHRLAGGQVGQVADLLFCVGEQGKLIASAAEKIGLNKKNIFTFEKSEDVINSVRKIMKPGDLILIKASRSMGLEKILEAIKK